MTNDLSIADKIGVGIAAGLIGTIVMTIGQKAEMALTTRPPSSTPAKAVEKVAGVELETADDKQRASTPIHWAYGTALGAILAGLDRIPEPARTGLFFASAWGGGAMLLNGLGLATPPHRQKSRDLATDISHHAVYALSAGGAYALFRNLAEEAATARTTDR